MADRLKSFQEVLSEAIDDMLEHGFDSVERVERWMRELRLAAERSMISPMSMEQQLRDALTQTYRRLLEKGDIAKYHSGVAGVKLAKVRPELRDELDRRIAASANLIKLNRGQAIDKTLQRFSGWSTSLPKGGVSAEKKRDVKANATKALASLPFEERRVLIDQGAKLVGAINEIVAADGGAIAGRWRSNWRQPGYNYREDHKERDNEIYLVRDSWADRAGYVKKAGRQYYDEVTAVGQEPFCRCYMVWLYNLRDLPDDMLTRKGREALSMARAKQDVYSAARADSVPVGLEALMQTDALETDDGSDIEGFQRNLQLFHQAEDADRLGYARGLKRIRAVPDHDEWNAQYDAGTITVQQKLFSKPDADQIHTLLHEIGHRGQDVDPETYEAFKRRHLNQLQSFLSIANPVHLRDFERTGKIDSIAAEAFAESYARFCLGLPLPDVLIEFWEERFAGAPNRSGLLSKEQTHYTDSWPNKVTRCQRCEMFTRLVATTIGNVCDTVAGDISAHGHCDRFFIIGARADSADEDVQPKVGAAADLLRLERAKRELTSLLPSD